MWAGLLEGVQEQKAQRSRTHDHGSPDQNKYVASHALRICAAQSLPVSLTGTGCFFVLKNDLPASSLLRFEVQMQKSPDRAA